MSYELGSGPRSKRGSYIDARRIKHGTRYKRPRRTASANYQRADGLGFSLKPPKFVRKAAKAIKKNVTLKRALIAGAVVGAAFIPGVAPAAARLLTAGGKVVTGAGRLVGRGVKSAGGGVIGLFKRRPGTAGGSTPGINPSGGFPGEYGPAPDTGAPAQYVPPPTNAGTYAEAPAAPVIYPPSGGGGMAPMSPADVTAEVPEAQAPSQAGFPPLAMVALLGVAIAASASGPKRRRRR